MGVGWGVLIFPPEGHVPGQGGRIFLGMDGRWVFGLKSGLGHYVDGAVLPTCP